MRNEESHHAIGWKRFGRNLRSCGDWNKKTQSAGIGAEAGESNAVEVPVGDYRVAAAAVTATFGADNHA